MCRVFKEEAGVGSSGGKMAGWFQSVNVTNKRTQAEHSPT